MPFTVEHVLVSQTLDLIQTNVQNGFFFRVAAQGKFLVLHPGRLQRDFKATVRHSMRIEVPSTQPPPLPPVIGGPGSGHDPGHGHIPDPIPQPLHNGVQVNIEGITLDLRILDPNGQLFTRNEITLADLKKYRTVRGSSRPWSFSISGTSRVYNPLPALNETVTEPQGSLHLGLTETVASTSAPPLVPRTRVEPTPMRFTFDVYRVGDFVATVSKGNFLSPPFRGSMRLLDPDGREVARTSNRSLRCPIPLDALGKSRDATGKPRLWTLEVISESGSGLGFNRHTVSATVIGAARVNTELLHRRLKRIFGPDGTFLKFKGVNVGDRAKALLTISDVASAETIDMFDLLDSRLKAAGQPTDIVANTPMVLFDRDSHIGYGARVDVSALKTTSISISVGPARHLPDGMPAVRLFVGLEGSAKVVGMGRTLATAKAVGGKVEVEVGIEIDPDGTPRFVSWVPSKPFDIDLSNGAIVAWIAAITAAGAGAGAIGGPFGAIVGSVAGLVSGALSVAAVDEAIENWINKGFSDGVKKIFDDPTLAPRVLMTILGTHLTYLPLKFQGSDLVFSFGAPLEPDPKPRRNYSPAIGRTLLEAAAGHTTFIPPRLGDTWAADNLKSKIDHIVVVMMENRSYDHVLGYRSIAPANDRDKADGWTTDLVNTVNARAELWRAPALTPAQPPDQHVDTNPPVHPMRFSAFPLNEKMLRTRLPKGVGHELEDVAEQLKGQIDGPPIPPAPDAPAGTAPTPGKRVNDPGGFIDNFRHGRLGNSPWGKDFVVPFDVLRYYEAKPNETDPNTGKPVNDLPMYTFLAENFAYCDKYYCSHPGPTLPNRMYSLAGDVQYDRYNFPILDNNDGDNFLLSRALSIFDIMTREGVSWRVYESEPSVAMARMFARYAGDNLNIRPVEEFARDCAQGNLPSVMIVEPAMHHHPQDDDHPDADMYRGQGFIKKVYDALRANPAIWAKTMLIITYDEHGGLYDHVIPPIADVFESPRLVVSDFDFDLVATDGGATTPPTGGAGTTGGTTGGTGPGGLTHGGLHIPPELLDILAGDIPEAVLSVDHTVKVPYGVRVPTFVVSPWVPAGKGPSTVFDHCSILKTILARFCGDKKPFLSDRVAASHSFESYVSEPAPRQVGAPPDLGPDLSIGVRREVSETSQIVTEPLFKKQMREGRVDYHDLSGRLARILGR